MKYRRLGKNGPTVSAIGLGAGSATTNFGERDDEVQIATVHRAMDLGVTLFDTADRYMKGRHERMLGRARGYLGIVSTFEGDHPVGQALFRESLELGYQLTPNVSVSGFVDHMSNANLAPHSAGITDAGARLGFKF